jgi:hypothetical protein
MKKIDLGKIIKAKKLDETEVAELLFPSNSYPKLALRRVVKGEGVLDADQISKFSLYSGIPIAELYTGNEWRSDIDGNKHVLVSGEYKAILDTSTWTTTIFHKESLFHEFIMHSPTIGLSEYIERLNHEISKNK